LRGAPQGWDQLRRADILSQEISLPKNISKDLCDLFRLISADFPAIVRENLVGICLWGSLTYDAFDDAVGDYFRVTIIVQKSVGIEENRLSVTLCGREMKWIEDYF
jgi:hypothetical protein